MLIDISYRTYSPKFYARLVWQQLFDFYRNNGGCLCDMDSILCDLGILEEQFDKKVPFKLNFHFGNSATYMGENGGHEGLCIEWGCGSSISVTPYGKVKKIKISRYDPETTEAPYNLIGVGEAEIFEPKEDYLGEELARRLRKCCADNDYNFKSYSLSSEEDYDYEVEIR